MYMSFWLGGNRMSHSGSPLSAHTDKELYNFCGIFLHVTFKEPAFNEIVLRVPRNAIFHTFCARTTPKWSRRAIYIYSQLAHEEKSQWKCYFFAFRASEKNIHTHSPYLIVESQICAPWMKRVHSPVTLFQRERLLLGSVLSVEPLRVNQTNIYV